MTDHGPHEGPPGATGGPSRATSTARMVPTISVAFLKERRLIAEYSLRPEAAGSRHPPRTIGSLTTRIAYAHGCTTAGLSIPSEGL